MKTPKSPGRKGASGKNLQPWHIHQKDSKGRVGSWYFCIFVCETCAAKQHIMNGKFGKTNNRAFQKGSAQMAQSSCWSFKLHQYHLSCALDYRKGLDKPLVAWIEIWSHTHDRSIYVYCICIHNINTTGKIIALVALPTSTFMERCMIYEQTSGKHIVQKGSYLDSCPGTLLTKVNLLKKQLHAAIPFRCVLKFVSAKIWVRSIGTFADELFIKNNSMQLAQFHLPNIAPFNFKYVLKILCWWFGKLFSHLVNKQLSKRFHSSSPKPAFFPASVAAFAWEMAWFSGISHHISWI